MILSSYCIENELTAKSGLSEMLREGLVTVAAMVRLLILRWYEPVSTSKIHGATLVQQVLAFLVQNGGAHAQSLWDTLCGSSGPFKAGTPQQFTSLLRKLHEQEIIFQDPSGLIMLAPKGEQITSHFSFYAAFSSSDEFRIVTAGRSLGSMPLNRPLTPGSFLIFAGRRWEVMTVDQDDKTVEVKPASGGTVPPFDGSMGAMIHDRVREEMRLILGSTDAIPFLDPTAQKLLNEARANYARLGLNQSWLLQMGADVEIVLWRGDAVNDTLLLMLLARGLRSMNDGVAVCVKDASVDNVREVLEAFRTEGAVDPLALASTVLNKVREKWDYLLPEELLNASFASANLDTTGVQEALEKHLEMA
jgi:ATP-dependent Lhr-like helicase